MSHTSTSIRSMGYFVNGGWSTHGSESVVKSPYDHSVLAVLSEAQRDDVELAIQSAVQAFPGHSQTVVAAARRHPARDR